MSSHYSRAHVVALQQVCPSRALAGLMITALLSMLLALAAPPEARAAGVGERAMPSQLEGRKHGGPKAYYLMCLRDPDLCKADQNAGRTFGTNPVLPLTRAHWDLMDAVNRQVNARVAPRDDMDVYGISDFWTAGRSYGDCEDYMIAKKQHLIDAGWSADQLLYAVVRGTDTPYHAVLVVRTDQGDFVLDNLTDDIVRWDRSGYDFVIRQSAEQPERWVRVVDGDYPVRQGLLAAR